MSLFINTLLQKKSSHLERPPIWLMRQAGRSLLAYNQLKKKYSFKTLLKTPSLACQVTELPLKELNVDAAILFSDILVVLEAMGVKVDYDAPQKKKPFVERPFKWRGKAIKYKVNLSSLEHNYEAIRLYKKKNSTPLIGFCASPLTSFLYLFEKKDEQFREALDCFYNHPRVSNALFNQLMNISLHYAQEQIKSGIDVFQLFDTWANIIPFSDYQKKIEPFIIKMVSQLSQQVPVIFFPRFFSEGYEHLSPKLLGYIHALSVDYLTPLPSLKKKLPASLILQGNLSPFVLRIANPKVLKKYFADYLVQHQSLIADQSWIINLGHGVLPDTPEENIKLLVKMVREIKKKKV